MPKEVFPQILNIEESAPIILKNYLLLMHVNRIKGQRITDDLGPSLTLGSSVSQMHPLTKLDLTPNLTCLRFHYEFLF